MTDTVAETEPQAQETAEVSEAPVFKNEDARASFNMIDNLIKDRNAKVGKINAVKGDHQTLREQLTESSEVPAAVAARAARDQAQEALDQAILDLHKAVQPEIEAVIADSEGTAKALEEEVKSLDATIKPALSFFTKMFGEDLKKHLTSLERLKGFTTKGAGAGGRRIRGYSAAVTIDGEATHFENVASVAKYLNVETTTLQEAFFNAAGNPAALKDAPDNVSFSVTFTDTYDDGTTEEKTASVVCTRDAKAEETVDAEETENTPESHDEDAASLV